MHGMQAQLQHCHSFTHRYNTCLYPDYIPISIQIVKGLRVELSRAIPKLDELVLFYFKHSIAGIPYTQPTTRNTGCMQLLLLTFCFAGDFTPKRTLTVQKESVLSNETVNFLCPVPGHTCFKGIYVIAYKRVINWHNCTL